MTAPAALLTLFILTGNTAASGAVLLIMEKIMGLGGREKLSS